MKRLGMFAVATLVLTSTGGLEPFAIASQKAAPQVIRIEGELPFLRVFMASPWAEKNRVSEVCPDVAHAAFDEAVANCLRRELDSNPDGKAFLKQVGDLISVEIEGYNGFRIKRFITSYYRFTRKEDKNKIVRYEGRSEGQPDITLRINAVAPETDFEEPLTLTGKLPLLGRLMRAHTLPVARMKELCKEAIFMGKDYYNKDIETYSGESVLPCLQREIEASPEGKLFWKRFGYVQELYYSPGDTMSGFKTGTFMFRRFKYQGIDYLMGVGRKGQRVQVYVNPDAEGLALKDPGNG